MVVLFLGIGGWSWSKMKKKGGWKRVSWKKGERNVGECEEERERVVLSLYVWERKWEKKERSLEWMREKGYRKWYLYKRKSRRERRI